MTQIIPTAEPFFLPTNNRKLGCLLTHGFTGAPKEMRWMGDYLHEKGYTCLGVRLAGHATHPEDMIRSRYTDWLASVEDGHHLLRGSVDHVILVGLSMGGVLSLLSSTRLDVAGVAVMSTPYALPSDPRMRYLKLLSLFMPYMPKSNLPPGSGWFDPQVWQDHVSYPQNPVRSIAELNGLLAEMRAALPQVKVPTLLIHSKDDTYVLPENMERIYADLGTSDKVKAYITGSGHVVPRDAARLQAFELALDFIRRVERSL
ncbi:MAG: alpha/beta fold hydrolase [Chloroflexi bacterium]|nr:alpha/beta fold hydrolase [Chloroflexota bacterium]